MLVMQLNNEKVPILRRGNLVIDLKCHNVIVHGKSAFLQAREMQLLYLLAEHPGWIYTKNQIFESIYDEKCSMLTDDFLINNRVYCLVRDLRKKLNDNSKHPQYIQTIRNIGYKFIVPEE
jgi:DNA-binding response OmpR family regulator